MTYAALAMLAILGDDFSRVDRDAIVRTLGKLQQSDGSYVPCPETNESDMRFLFCACAISFLLNDWGGVDKERATDFIRKSRTYEHAFGQRPNGEAHGGSTYCAIAALHLMGRSFEDIFGDREPTVRWLLSRQRCGFHGRPDKPDDTCYAFWVGASLEMLDAYRFVDTVVLKSFMQMTRSNFV
ncbi:Geranylgeranyl transferase type-1 subunit beta [Borealophlyctis nickersoniae]|nr:Geranylgeranyl transferase type-1 subunit beta [Borealophlyctis nickersoniae]